MNNIIISYSLFGENNSGEDFSLKFWNNIPALIAINLMIYKNAAIWIYLPEDLIKHPLYEILEKLSEKFDALKLKFLSFSYHNSEPTLWKYKPLFDKSSEIVLLRELQAIPNEMEIRATQFFIEQPNFYIGNLRTHHSHLFPTNKILSSLGSFRPNKIGIISNMNFNEFYFQFKGDLNIVEKKSIIEIFTKDEEWTKKYFLDCAIQSKQQKINKPAFPCKSIESKKYENKVNLNHISKELLGLLNNITNWGGEPIDFRGENLEKLLEHNNLITFKLKKVLMDCSNYTQNFYLNG